jgi:hypothetical protein
MIQELIREIQSEIQSEKDTVVKRAIQDELKTFVFDEKNLSPTLIALIMAKSGSATDSGRTIDIPIIKGVPLPSQSRETAKQILDFINIDTSAIVEDLTVGNNVYLYGRAGTGKTTLAKKIAQQILKRDVFTINCNQFTSPVELRGGQTIEGYKDGNMVLAWEKGAVLILDELPKLDPNTAGLLNEALALSADQPITEIIPKEEYDNYLMKIEAAAKIGRYLGYEVYQEGDKYFRKIDITITDGKGDLRKRGEGFCVIATGNTDMKTTSTNYSGNNRQDYSLVDRFAGSFYKIEYDAPLERKLTYEKVYNISIKIREFLDKESSSVESISLRTMLNFNRIYEQEMLRQIGSKFAVPVIKFEDKDRKIIVEGKSLADSVNSFIDTLPDAKRTELRKTTDIGRLLVLDSDESLFIEEFKRMHDGVNPLTGQRD